MIENLVAISILDKYCKEEEVLAMAAVQLGIPKRIIYLKNTNLNIVNKKRLKVFYCSGVVNESI